MFTGTPQINAISLPYADNNTPVVQSDSDESRYLDLHDGTRKIVGNKRVRSRFTFGYAALDEATFESLIAELLKPAVTFIPRTGSGSPAPPSYQCRCTSDIPALRLIHRTTYEINIVLETLTITEVAP